MGRGRDEASALSRRKDRGRSPVPSRPRRSPVRTAARSSPPGHRPPSRKAALPSSTRTAGSPITSVRWRAVSRVPATRRWIFLSEEGRTASLGGDAEATAALNAAPESRPRGRHEGRVDRALQARSRPQARRHRVRFGGGMVWLHAHVDRPRPLSRSHPAHHVKAQAPSKSVVTTQLYFTGEAQNASDGTSERSASPT